MFLAEEESASVLENICSQPGVLKSLYVISFLLNTIKILIPIVIIVIGIIAFTKEVFNDKNDLKGPTILLIKKVIIGLLIPFVYTIAMTLFRYFDDEFDESNYDCVFVCLKSQSDCKSKYGSIMNTTTENTTTNTTNGTGRR